MELELEGKRKIPMRVKGFAWSDPSIHYTIGPNQELSLRNALFETRSKSTGFPVAMVKAECRCQVDQWVKQEIYVAPIWDDLIQVSAD